MPPFRITQILSACTIVEYRWATTREIRSRSSRSNASCTCSSVNGLTELVIRLIQDEDARLDEQRAGERDELALPGGELHAPLVDVRIVAVRQLADEVIGIRQRG